MKLFGLILDVADGVFHCTDFLGILIGNVNINASSNAITSSTMSSESAQNVNETTDLINLRLVDTKLLNDDLLHLLCQTT